MMSHLSHPPPHLPVLLLEMAHSSNVIIHGSTFNSAQGDIHINKTDSGMYDLSPFRRATLSMTQ